MHSIEESPLSTCPSKEGRTYNGSLRRHPTARLQQRVLGKIACAAFGGVLPPKQESSRLDTADATVGQRALLFVKRPLSRCRTAVPPGLPDYSRAKHRRLPSCRPPQHFAMTGH